jgi:glutathione synthase/RimK-type ligase-like ATP-grasp enzyme
MIGIHDRPGSYSDRWIKYCTEKGISFRRVNCLATDVVPQCEGLDAVLWHWSHGDPASLLVARQIIAALESMGLVVFPNVATCWHFDDKVAQKYLLEAIGAPLIPTWVFTNLKDALQWVEQASWPKVFKLRCGAGSKNVRLVRSRSEAQAFCRRAFGRGFPAMPTYFSDIGTRLQRVQARGQLLRKIARLPWLFLQHLTLKARLPAQRGYIYFQEFVPGNDHDTRVTVIGERAFAFCRANRPGDFRASGSGTLRYAPEAVDPRCIRIAFAVTQRLQAQSLAFDFLLGPQGEPRIAEISYCYMPEAVHDCPGYSTPAGDWRPGHLWPEHAIITDLLLALGSRGKGQATHLATGEAALAPIRSVVL